MVAPTPSLKRQAVVLASGRTVALLFSIGIPMVLARSLTQEQFGGYRQVFLIVATIIPVIDLGMNASLFYFLPRESERRDAYLTQTFMVLVGMGLAFLGVSLIGHEWIGAIFHSPEVGQLMVFVSLLALMTALSNIGDSIMVSAGHASIASLTIVSFELLRAFVLITIGLTAPSLSAIILGVLAVTGARILWVGVYLRRQGYRFRWEGGILLPGQFRFAIPFGIAVIFSTVSVNAHQYLVAALRSPSAFALYAVGCFQIPFVAIFFHSLSDITLVRVTQLQKDGRLQEILRILHQTTMKLALVFFPLTMGMMVVGRDFIVTFFSERYADSVPIFLIYLFTVCLTAMGLDFVPRAFNETTFILRLFIGRLLITVPVVWAMLNFFGLRGAIIGEVLCMSVQKVIVVRKVMRLLRVPVSRIYPWGHLLRIFWVSVFACAGGAVGLFFRSSSVQLALLISIVLYGTVYGIVGWRTNLLDDEEKRMIVLKVRAMTGRSSSWQDS